MKATIFLKGGFGNQLFQIVFANELKKIGYSTTINTDLLNTKDTNTRRGLVLPIEDFNFFEQSLFSKGVFYLGHWMSNSSVISKLDKKKILNVFKYTKENDLNLDNKSKRLYLNGYWKNIKYLENNEDFLISSLMKNTIIKKGLLHTPDPNKALIHVRRTDFVKNGWDLKSDYFKKSIDTFKKLKPKIRFDVFTDDEHWVANNSCFDMAENIYPQINNPGENSSKLMIRNQNQETIETFSNMLNYENYIVGNSSFAFWAAYLKSTKTSLVSVPNPWFRNHEHPILKKDNWLIIETN